MMRNQIPFRPFSPVIAAVAGSLLMPFSSHAQGSGVSSKLENHEKRISRLEAKMARLGGGGSADIGAGTKVPASHTHFGGESATHRVRPGESLSKIAREHGSSVHELATLNGIDNPDRLEVGQMIHLPGGEGHHRHGDAAEHGTHAGPAGHAGHESHPSDEPFRGPVAVPDTHRAAGSGRASEHVVKPGDTLFRVASEYGLSTSDLREANGIFTDHIFVGQRLHIPSTSEVEVSGSHGGGGAATHAAAPVETEPRATTHEVKPGETSASIARVYGVSVSDLANANSLSDPGRIFIGQSLKIPSGAAGFEESDPQSALRSGATNRAAASPENFATYKVRRGDTVSSIGREFKISPNTIIEANGLSQDGSIRSGQELIIPVDQFWATLSPPA